MRNAAKMFSFDPNPTTARKAWSSSTCLLYVFISGHRFHGIDSLREINSVVELILLGEGMKISEASSSFVVYGGRTSNTQTIGHDRLDSILGSCSIPGIDFSSHNPSKNTGSALFFGPSLALEQQQSRL
jgi:hypothetical protein